MLGSYLSQFQSLSSHLLLNGKTLLLIVVVIVVSYITVITTGVSPILSAGSDTPLWLPGFFGKFPRIPTVLISVMIGYLVQCAGLPSTLLVVRESNKSGSYNRGGSNRM